MNQLPMFERLEDRTLLAVSVSLSAKKGILTLQGDAASDDVEIDGIGAGEVQVYVNGAFAGTFSGVKTIKGNLGAGDDFLGLAAIHIGGSVDVRMGAGADEFDVDDDPSFGGPAQVFIGGSVIINFGGNPGDFADWDNDAGFGITIGNNVTFTGVADVDFLGDGGDFGVQPADINIGGFLKISLNGAGNVGGEAVEMYLTDVNVGGTTVITGSAAVDRVHFDDCSFARRVAISLGAGDDRLDLDNGGFDENAFAAAVVFNGGKGTDTFDNQPDNAFAIAPVVKGFETVI